MKRKKIKTILEILSLLAFGLILYASTYIIKNDDINTSIDIVKILISSGGMMYLVIPYLIVLAIQFIIKGLVKENWKTNIITTIIVVLVTIISFYKQNILQLPFIPSDILLVGNIDQIAEFGLTFPPINIILIGITLFSILLLQYIINKKFDSLKTENSIYIYIQRGVLFVIGVVLLYNLCISPSRYIKFNIKNDLGNNYFWMGGNAVFFMHLGDFYSIAPDGYSEDNIDKIKKETINNIETQVSNIKNPNVIMIMNESFSNPNNLKNIQYYVNPIKNIEELAKNDKNCIIGNTITPVYGGGTSLPEFEVLTGLSSYFIEKQIFPYASYIRNNMNSLVRVYNKNDYTTIGIHTNTQTFYNRMNVYKYLGFEETIFEEDIKDPEIKGIYISDNELANQVIKKFEENSDKRYIFAVSMQNHMPYTGDKYNKYDVEITSDVLKTNELNELKNYIQGIYDTDKMYIKLVNYLKNVQEPTILVMFGDHLPSLNSIYKKSQYNGLDFYTTPYIIWANYDIDTSDIPKYLSPSNLSINVMKIANIQIPWYLRKFEELYKKYPVIDNQGVITNEGKILSTIEIDKYDLVNDCRILQYDLLIKKKYIDVE